MVDKESRKEFPLKSVSIEANIYDTKYTHIKMIQDYYNPSDTEKIETQFRFPVDCNFALKQLTIEF